MNFVFKNGLIWITIELLYDSRLYRIENCILDTGSASTAIDIENIEFNFNTPAKIKRLYGIGSGTQEVVSQKIDEFRIDGKKISNQEIEFGDFNSKIGINGFVGTDILQCFDVSIDFKELEILLK
jgi:hypothetical protein